MNDIKVTVYLSTYNQEPYIREALDSILMQKVNFKYELLAADDCSSDKTQDIILEYQKKYPDIIKTYFTPVNVGGCQKLVDCINNGLFKGDYLAYLEGDDYWLNENRLQILVDFLDGHPKYSRVSHKRMVIDENRNEKGYDIPNSVLGKDFTIEDFLEGKNYSDFGSVFRNYFKEVGGKYNELFLKSKNVCDFQDMFITQDFGPVYVMDECFGVYRSISGGGTNYNSITTQSYRAKENITLAKAVESFYEGKYDLTPMVLSNTKKLLKFAIDDSDAVAFNEAKKNVSQKSLMSILAELNYLSLRGKRKEEIAFVHSQLDKSQRLILKKKLLRYSFKRVYNKVFGIKTNELLRGYVVKGEIHE